MKKMALLVSTLIFISCTNSQKTEFSKQALTQTLLSKNGSQVAFDSVLKKHLGKTLVIEIWASWCGDCIKAMPKIKALQAKNPTVDFVFISMDRSSNQWLMGIEKHQLVGNHYMANDEMKGVFGKAMDVNWIPRYLIVDKTGKIALYKAIETDFDLIDETLSKLK
jgi:thiol-disulfide isomerase/thioredoxin